MPKIAVLGAGGFGIALALLSCRNGADTTLFSPFPEEIALLSENREHEKLLPGIHIDSNIQLSCDPSDVYYSDYAVVAVPSFAVRGLLKQVPLSPDTIIVNVAKGLEEGTHKRLSCVIKEECPDNEVVVLSGPSHAEEVARQIPTTVVAASAYMHAAKCVQDAFMNASFRIYVNDDLIGVELGGALKNVIALAAGICDGLQIGDNPKAALMTRGISEIARLGVALGAKTETFGGLSGIGDLIVTCTSEHSRNHLAGKLIGQGVSAADAIAQVGKTVEGYKTAKVAYELSQIAGVEMPIVQVIYQVLYEGKTPQMGMAELMTRDKKHEMETTWIHASAE